MLKTSVNKDDFLKKFYHELKDENLERNNRLNLFTLRIQNNSFVYNELIEILGNNLCLFALSKTVIEELSNGKKFDTIVKKAKDKLRKYIEIKQNESENSPDNEGGEIGELLLYCLLESHLEAPKILTKLEIKTSNKMYVHGADGVHLHKTSDSDYQLIFGESKLYSDLSAGIQNAFGSIQKLLDNTNEKLNFEFDLLNTELVKECCSDKEYEFLKRIIIPNANEDNTNLDYSFAIFLGFNVDVSENDRKMDKKVFRVYLRDKVKNEVNNVIKSINYQIKKTIFNGYDFYIYIIPFTNLAEERLRILGELSQ